MKRAAQGLEGSPYREAQQGESPKVVSELLIESVFWAENQTSSKP